MAYLMLADDSPEAFLDNYVYVPTQDGGGKWVREDFFDNLPPDQWNQVMDLLGPLQRPGVEAFPFTKKWKEQRAAKKEARQAKKAQKEYRKTLKAESKADARINRSQGGGFLDKVGNLAKDIFGGTPVDAGVNIETGATPSGYFRAGDDAQPFYTKPAFIIGGLVVIGGIVYLVTRKKAA